MDSPDLPTLIPTEYIPTVVALTLEARGIALNAGERTPTNPPVDRDSTASPEVSQTPTPSPAPTATPVLESQTPAPPVETAQPPPTVPYATIQILSPGQGSRLASPFLLSALIEPGPKGVVQVELLGEDGRLLLREVRLYDTPENTQVSLALELEYEIPAVAEASRAQISIEDEDGLLKAVASVDVLLLSLGEPELNPVGDFLENIVIESPTPKALIQGGMVRVAGLARLRSDQPLMIEIHTADGKIVGTRQVPAVLSPGSMHGTFVVDVPYTVSSPSKARLMVWERGDRIPGIVHLSSVEVMLSP